MNIFFKKIVLCAISACIYISLVDGQPTCSQTFFSTQSPYQIGYPIRNSEHNLIARQPRTTHILHVTPFASFSVHNTRIANYFLPNCSDTVSASTIENQFGDLDADLDGQHFNIVTKNGRFYSVTTFKPEHRIIGIGISYHRILSHCNEDAYWWFELASSLQRVTTKITMHERISDSGGGVERINPLPGEISLVGSLTQAFNQSSWKYGKIDSQKHHDITRLADIEGVVGYDWHYASQAYGSLYGGIVLPTGNKSKAEYVFEPIAGNNRHVGLFFGGSFYLELSSNLNYQFYINLATTHRFLFKNTQKRSFDLKNKPWSRYMEMYENFAQAQQAHALVPTNPDAAALLATPGINILTKDVTAEPKSKHSILCALICKHDCFTAELGYQAYAQQAEKVSCKDTFKEQAVLKSFEGGGIPNAKRTINDRLRSVTFGALFSKELYDRSIIKTEDLNLHSAAHPAFVSQTLYLNLDHSINMGYVSNIFEGISYEFSKDNAALTRVVFWAGIQANF